MRTCRVEEKLVREILAMNGQLNSLSPTWVRDEDERNLIQTKRDELSAELRHHHAKGHGGKRCPARDSRKGSFG